LSDFFKKHYPHINLQTELEKDALIERLASSPNFTTTHSLIAELSKFNEFTQRQVEDLFQALLLNAQVNWIIMDEDVHSFYENLYARYFFSVLQHTGQIEALLSPEKRSGGDDVDVPF
jgi:hypothetical protein